MYRVRLLLFLLVLPGLVMAQTPSRWRAHEMGRPRPPVVTPGASMLPAAPPSDALVLFDGRNFDAWQGEDGGAPRWTLGDGYFETVGGAGMLVTKQAFGDVQLHIEWSAPLPVVGRGQGRGNSGVFFMGQYEVQVLDSYQNDTYPDGQAAALYGQYPPMVNAMRPPGEWNSYDIVFRRPRFDPTGALVQPARLTVFHNGVLVQDAAELLGPTLWLQYTPYASHPDRLPLSLQDHGNPVRFRNIWLRELPEFTPAGPMPSTEPVAMLSADVLQRFTGRYAGENSPTINVMLEAGVLRANFYGPLHLELIPRSDRVFDLRHTAGRLTFDLDASGHPTGVAFDMGGETYHARKVP